MNEDRKALDSSSLADLIRREIHQYDGIFYGMLQENERAVVDRAVELGMAVRDYSGVGGLLGLSKVKVLCHLP